MNSQILLCLFLLLSNSLLFANWHDRKAEGWAWYEERRKHEEEKVLPKTPATPSEQLQEIRQKIEEKLAKAVLEPTPENIKAYMTEQQKWVDHSAYFAQVWEKILLSYPHLDNTAKSLPVSQYGLQYHKQEQQIKKESLIASLAKSYGLFFFYEGKSEISLFFGQIVKEFSKKYDMQTVAISVDGVKIEGFESHKKDNGIASTLGVDVMPALYLIDPQTDTAVPISFGLVGMDKIEDNIVLQFQEDSKK